MMSPLHRFAGVAATLLAILSLATASSVASAASPYRCQPKGTVAAPPPAPPQPAAAKASQPAAVAADAFTAPCPAGQVPYPSATPGAGIPKVIPPMPAKPRRRRRTHRVSAHAARGYGFGYYYSWAQGGPQHFGQGANVYAQFASLTVEQPYIDYTHGITGAHSLGQIWTTARPDPNHLSDVETGWIEDAGQYNDTVPHLFISLFDYNAFVGFVGQASIPWVQNSSTVFPNMALPASNTTPHTFGTELYGGNWWIDYDGQWVGYLPPSAWHSFFPNSVTDVSSGGEVATLEQSTCTDMGYNGLFGTSAGAASDTTNYYLGAGGMQNTAFTPYASDPSNYNTGNWVGGYNFRYGGPGWC